MTDSYHIIRRMLTGVIDNFRIKESLLMHRVCQSSQQPRPRLRDEKRRPDPCGLSSFRIPWSNSWTCWISRSLQPLRLTRKLPEAFVSGSKSSEAAWESLLSFNICICRSSRSRRRSSRLRRDWKRIRIQALGFHSFSAQDSRKLFPFFVMLRTNPARLIPKGYATLMGDKWLLGIGLGLGT